MKKKEHSKDFIRATLSFHEMSGNSVEKTAQTFDVEQETLVSWMEEHGQETIPFVRGESAHQTVSKEDVVKTWMELDSASQEEGQAFVQPVLGTYGVSKRKEVLGEGGMGIVYSATQLSMGREVALKELKADRKEVVFRRALLQEAWIVGLLEHPNILPIYTIEQNEDGLPMILMKKIEGKTWAYYLANQEEAQAEFSYTDFLSWNIEIMMQVCNAISYAHDRGFLHRDIKPENVMIGDYGVVFVLDWGLSVALDERHSSWLPRAKDVHTVAGSPAYMAPEMARVTKESLSPATDIYLLGATLYEVYTGEPPHHGSSLSDMMDSIAHFVPSFSQATCTRLQAIIARCMKKKPDERFESVEELLKVLQQYLQYRDFIPVMEAMNQDIKAIVRKSNANGDRGELYEHFFSARFAFRQLHNKRLLNKQNHEDFREATFALARWEITQENPETSEILLESWKDSIGEDLKNQIETEKERQQNQRLRLEKIEISRSRTIGARTRMAVVFYTIITWTLLPAWVLIFDAKITFDLLHNHTLVSIAIFIGIGMWGRHSISSTERNRQVYAILLCEPIFHGFSDITYQLLGYDPEQVWAMRFMVWLAMIASYAVLLEKRMLIITGIYAFVTLWVVQNPIYVPQTSTVLNLGLCGVMFFLWRDEYTNAEDARKIDKGKFL